jgi:Icc-related predicted phosphoesterase
VPQDVDILVTHSPPFGILDTSAKGRHGGSKALREVTLSRKPKFHIFGHIHEGRGMEIINGIKFLNVSKQPTKL